MGDEAAGIGGGSGPTSSAKSGPPSSAKSGGWRRRLETAAQTAPTVVAVVVETQSHIPKGAGVVVVSAVGVVAVTVAVLVEPQLELVAPAESVEVDEVLSLTSIVEVV